MPRHLPTPLADHALLQAAKLRKGDTIGDFVTWNLSNVEIAPDDLHILLRKYGIEDFRPVEIRQKTAARKAITLIRPTLESGDLRVIVRRMWDNDEEVRFAIVGETADLTRKDLDYSTLNQVIFNKKEGLLSFTKEEIPAIRKKFEYLSKVYTQREVQMMLVNITERHGGTALGDGSGFYFVPAQMKQVVNSLISLVNTDLQEYVQQGGFAVFRAFGIMNTESDKQQVSSFVREDILRELEEAERYAIQVMGRVLENPEHSRNDNSLNAALQRFKAAQGKAMMYREVLSMDLKEAEAKIQETTRGLEQMLGLDSVAA